MALTSEKFCFGYSDETHSFQPIKTDLLDKNQFWLHLIRTDDNAILDLLEVNEHEKETLLAESTRPYFRMVTDQEFILFLRAINLNPDSEPEDMVSLRILCHGTRLITVINRPVQAIRETRALLESNTDPIHSVMNILQILVGKVLSKIETHVKVIVEKIDKLEELEDENKVVPVHELHDLRRTLSRLSRFTIPQLETFKKLATSQLSWIKENEQQSLTEFVNRMTYLNEEINLTKERAEILNNELTSNINNKVNRNLYVISLITVLFLPLSFITGLLGINVGGIPGSSSELGFTIVITLSVIILIIQLIVLKIFKWF